MTGELKNLENFSSKVMSLTVQQLLSDAKRLTGRLRDHDSSTDGIISAAQDVLKEVEAMRQYQEDIESLNKIAHNRPRAQLVLGIQQENRHIRQLQHENKELRAALEEHQNVLELIMSKYRQHMSCLLNSTKIEKDQLMRENTRVMQDRADKICEMANIMQKSIQIDEENIAKEHETMARLITENRGLREMLEISHHNGSYSNPLAGPRLVSTGCQTDTEVIKSDEKDPSAFNNPSVSSDASSSPPAAAVSDPLLTPAADHSTTTTCTSPQISGSSPGAASPSSSNLVINGALQDEVASPQRPLSSASEESESSFSEDDEISFNTIKRQIKPMIPVINCDQNTAVSHNNHSTSASPPGSTPGTSPPPPGSPKQLPTPAATAVNSKSECVEVQLNGGTKSAEALPLPLEDNNNGHPEAEVENSSERGGGNGSLSGLEDDNIMFSKKLSPSHGGQTTPAASEVIESTSS